MSSYTFFHAVGAFCGKFLGFFYDNVGNIFNNFLIVVGFIGLFYWLKTQYNFNTEAKNNPNQIK